MIGNILLLKIVIVFGSCVIVLLLLIFLFYNLRTFFLGEAPFVPTRNKVLPHIINALNLNTHSVLYDIGCGDGRILAAAIRKTKGATGIGIDLNPFACLIARVRNKTLPVKIYRGDIFNYSLSEATHVYCYLLPNLLEKLEAKIKNECHEGTVIITCDFCFPTFIPKQEIKSPPSALGCDKIYVYKV